MPYPPPLVFEFFAKAENLGEITPPWLHFHLLHPTTIGEGTLLEYALRIRGVPVRWVSRIENWNPPHSFVDVQVKGPYRFWRHTHRFEDRNGGTQIIDTVEYAMPFGPIGRLVHMLQVARDLRKIFDYRTERVLQLFAPSGLRRGA